MSTSNGHDILSIGVTVSDSAASVYRIMQGDTTDTTTSLVAVKAATAETTKPIGVLQIATTAADEKSTMRVLGISLVEMNGDTIDIGSSIMADTAGKGAVSSTPDAGEQWAIGFALAPSTADGDIIPVLLDRHLIVEGAA